MQFRALPGFFYFFFNDTATTEIYTTTDTLSLHDALPIYQLLGGASRDRVPIYNTCGGPAYGRPPYEVHGRAGPLEDLYAWNNAPAELAAELLEDGISAMK